MKAIAAFCLATALACPALASDMTVETHNGIDFVNIGTLPKESRKAKPVPTMDFDAAFKACESLTTTEACDEVAELNTESIFVAVVRQALQEQQRTMQAAAEVK